MKSLKQAVKEFRNTRLKQMGEFLDEDLRLDILKAKIIQYAQTYGSNQALLYYSKEVTELVRTRKLDISLKIVPIRNKNRKKLQNIP